MLEALAEEFGEQIGQNELRQLMHRVGQRFATANPLAACNTTPELSDAVNGVWNAIDWGFAELTDAPDHLRIVHYCAPLLAFGSNAIAWTPAFLEGTYQGWLTSIGAEGLSVVQASEFSEDASLEFRLGRNAG